MYPYLNYAAEVWANANDSYLVPIVKLQKRALRIITHSSRLEHTEPLFHKLKILKINEIHVYKVAYIMFKVYHSSTPAVFNELFIQNCKIHDHNTRQSKQYHVPSNNTNYRQNAISFEGVKIWNKISQKVNYDCSDLSFKIAVKQYVLNSKEFLS